MLSVMRLLELPGPRKAGKATGVAKSLAGGGGYYMLGRTLTISAIENRSTAIPTFNPIVVYIEVPEGFARTIF